jgi:hypothetical protein
MPRFLLVVLMLGALVHPATAQESSALINKALDEQFNVTIDATLPNAMEIITRNTGVPLREDPAIWDLLPWGRETKIQARFENVTLREALRIITRTLGLRMVLRDEYVEIQPAPALKRLAQRASRDELMALDVLSSRPLNLGEDHPTLARLLEAVDLKLAAEKDVQLAVENRTTDAIAQDKRVFVPRNATLMDALDSLPKDTRATWYPWGRSIMIVTKEDRTRRLLSRPLTIRPGDRGTDVLQMLMDLSTRTGVAFEFQPGAIQSLPAEARLVRGIFDNAPAQQILEAIAGATGLAYAIQDDRVIITSAPGVAAGPRDRAIGFIQLDNGLQVLIPTSQVPLDLQEYIQHKTRQQLNQIRQMMEEEGFKPSNKPEEPRDL